MHHLKIFSTLLAVSLGLLLPATLTAAEPKAKTVILATTTSTQDSGLLDLLIPAFEKESGFQVKTIAVGSGQALKMGERGEADVLLVHSPEAEKTFMASGFGTNSLLVMHNDFIIVGPKADPAKLHTSVGIANAMKQIANTGSIFISRGDNSGTHARERALWKAAGIAPDGSRWYQQTGLGMGQTLQVTAEKKAYTLTDRATYLAMKKHLNLDILFEGAAPLLNIYHVIEVNARKWPKVNSAGAKAFADFLVSRKAQQIIGSFGLEKFGVPLFAPDAGRRPADLGL